MPDSRPLASLLRELPGAELVRGGRAALDEALAELEGEPVMGQRALGIAERQRRGAHPLVRGGEVAGSLAIVRGGSGGPGRDGQGKVLAESREHPTAETVFLKIRAQVPRLSLATVYRNLRLFADAGIVDAVATGDSFARFDGNTEPHHHLICRRCGSVTDYYATSLDDFTPSKAALDGFEVQSMKMNFFGVCASCSDKRTKNTARREK